MTSAQQQAINKTEGPTIILAGAGTGKSYTLKKKAVHLVNELNLYKPSEILCLTFSNEATNSLRNGMQEELKTTDDVVVKTFHSFCADVLRDKGHLIGVQEGFEILLPDDAKIMIHKYLDVTPYWANRYISTILSAKDFGVSIQEIKEYASKIKSLLLETTEESNFDSFEAEARKFLQTFYLFSKEERKENKNKKKLLANFVSTFQDFNKFTDFIEVWEGYDALKKERNYLDFSDLNELALQVFEQFGADDYNEQYKYVFVDEFQDTNKLQFRLIEFIAAYHNITVVGDPNQSIYGFRGAFKDSFEHFKQIFNADDSCVFKLDKSWRSPNTVLNISYDLIKKNYENEANCVYVQNVHDIQGNKVNVISTINAGEEARLIANLVQERINNNVPLNEICILHRTHQQAKIIKEALEMKDIPVISAGRTNLLQRPEIKTAIGYLSMLSNIIERSGTGEQAWWYLFHYHNTLSLEDSMKIGRYLKKVNYDIPQIEQESIDSLLITALEKLDLSEKGKKIISRITLTLQQLVEKSNKVLPELVLDIFELSGLNRAFSYERSISNIEAMLNLKKFYELAVNFYELHEKSISKFVEYIEMIDNLGVTIDASKIIHVDAVRLMTIHACKGLEFDTVIVSNMAHDRFPITRTRNEPLIPKELLPDFKAYLEEINELAIADKAKEQLIKDYDKKLMLLEERRLCYVAWTRARKELILTYANDYKGEPNSTIQSEFLDEIKFLENENVEFVKDEQETSMLLAHQSPYETELSQLKAQIVGALDTESYEDLQKRLATYVSCKTGSVIEGISQDDVKEILAKSKSEQIITFDASSVTFSATALINYSECPKKYELEKIYQMPERGAFENTGEGSVIGSFIHKVCEVGVNRKLNSLDKFKELARELHVDDFKTTDLDEADIILEVFWERNKSKITEKSITEMKVTPVFEGFKFIGFLDRVDILEDGSVEIIDYKTNKNPIPPEKRALQLGFYALALQDKGYRVSKLTLDMLRLEKPIEMAVDEQGNVTALTGCSKTSNFNLNELKEKIIEMCKAIAHDYEHGFEVADDENACRWCGYKFYCPKWEEK